MVLFGQWGLVSGPRPLKEALLIFPPIPGTLPGSLTSFHRMPLRTKRSICLSPYRSLPCPQFSPLPSSFSTGRSRWMRLGRAGVRMKETGNPDLTSCILGHPQILTQSVAALKSAAPSRNSLCTGLLPKPLGTWAPPWRSGPKKTQKSPVAERGEGARSQKGTEGVTV